MRGAAELDGFKLRNRIATSGLLIPAAAPRLRPTAARVRDSSREFSDIFKKFLSNFGPDIFFIFTSSS